MLILFCLSLKTKETCPVEREHKNYLTNNTSFSGFDLFCMRRALVLARRGAGKVSPNPQVGAVLARDGRIIGEGWHKHYGGKHAEAEAVAAVLAKGDSPGGADLYCTLEPCCFTAPDKHQRPCTDLILESGIKRVVIAGLDPNPRVNGAGVGILREAGIRVETGLLAEAGEELNRGFFTFQRRGRPFVHIKIAQSLDGRIAALGGGPPGSHAPWITDEAARKIVHRLRSRYDAVLVGRGTIAADDPELTVRLCRGPNPLRVVLDSRLRLPDDAKVLSLPDQEKTLLVCGNEAGTERREMLRAKGVEVICLGEKGLPLGAVLDALGKRGIRSVLVEGGGAVFSSFLREGLWDRLSVFTAPIILGDGVSAVSGLGTNTVGGALQFTDVSIKRIGRQTLFEGNHVYGNN